jgi:hypothetical protein
MIVNLSFPNPGTKSKDETVRQLVRNFLSTPEQLELIKKQQQIEESKSIFFLRSVLYHVPSLN